MVYGGGEALAAAQIKGKLNEFYDRSWQLQLICIFGGSGRYNQSYVSQVLKI
jgi:hypothetical protein